MVEAMTTRRIKRLTDFDLTLEIKNDDFISPPRQSQRNWLLNQAMNEVAHDLMHLDMLARHFVPGADGGLAQERTHAVLDDEQIMEDWQIPLMRAMAQIVAGPHNHVLEVGFGRGISAELIQQAGVAAHTIVECNDSVVQRFHAWRARYPDRTIRLIQGKWQDVADQFDLYDGIFFHTYPLNHEEYLAYVAQSVTFAEHFFPTAAAHLKPGGVFTYFTAEIDSFGRAHQRALFRYFSEFTLRTVRDLPVPADVRDSWWIDSMVVIKAIK
jgi:guanidinoacetate N-methyltransferase